MHTEKRGSWFKHFSVNCILYCCMNTIIYSEGFCALDVGRGAHNFTRQQGMMVHWDVEGSFVSSCLGMICIHAEIHTCNLCPQRLPQLSTATPLQQHVCLTTALTVHTPNTIHNVQIHTTLLNIEKSLRPSWAAAGGHLSSWIFMDCNDAKMNSISSAWSHWPFGGDTWLLLAAVHLSRRTSPYLSKPKREYDMYLTLNKGI